VHSKCRNRLYQRKLIWVIFVKYNLKLRQSNAKGPSSIQPPICLYDSPYDEEWITKQEPPTLAIISNWLGVHVWVACKEAREASDDKNLGRVNVAIVRNACNWSLNLVTLIYNLRLWCLKMSTRHHLS